MIKKTGPAVAMRPNGPGTATSRRPSVPADTVRRRPSHTRLYSFRFSCRMVSFTAAKTKRMFSVSVAHVKCE